MRRVRRRARDTAGICSRRILLCGMSDEASRTNDDVKPPRTRRRVDVNVQVVSYNTRGYRAKHTTIPKACRIKDRSFRAHPRLVVVPCVRLLYEAAPFLPSPSPDLFASARRSARLRFASFLRTRKHNRHVFSSPSKSRNTSSAFRQLLQNRLGSAPRPVAASTGGTVFVFASVYVVKPSSASMNISSNVIMGGGLSSGDAVAVRARFASARSSIVSVF